MATVLNTRRKTENHAMTGAEINIREESRDPLLAAEGGEVNNSSNNSNGNKNNDNNNKSKSDGIIRKNRIIDYNTSITYKNLIQLLKKKGFIILIGFIVIVIYANAAGFPWDTSAEKIPVYHHSHVPGMKAITLPPGFLVYSDKCKMPNMDPYAPDVMQYFKREKYQPCSSKQPLTKTIYNSKKKVYILHLEESLRDEYTKSRGSLDCCYQSIERSGKGAKADKDYKLGSCVSFTKSIQIPQNVENILVQCKSNGQRTYINGHALVQERPELKKRLSEWQEKDTKRPISVLLLGIDSISRQNLIRAMPKTAQYLYDTEWFEMSGYNKIDDNTFPNLMAVLAGYNQTTAFHKCSPYKVGSLDKCPMIWYEFQKRGYVTAYAEDEASINTFNYLKKGFEKPPTDYYLRPFLLAAEAHLPIKRKSSLTFCLGYQHSADYVYDYALEFASNYKDETFFGLFWANTFSHNVISDCSSMDDKMVKYLHKFTDRGILNRSVIIFFSDHGMRFGPTRKLLSGHYEERLPFFFLWLPSWLKDNHPEFLDALNVNKNRLTNPYDVHMTLKHILELSGRAKGLPNAEDCPNCQTLLRPVPHSRSCDDIAIEDHWCTCYPYQSVSTKSPLIHNILKYTIDYINDYVATYKNGSVSHLCAKITLHHIKNAYKIIKNQNVNQNSTVINSYRVVFETMPGQGLFEASIRHNTVSNEFDITGSISRLNTYAKDSACIGDGGAKKYCFCTKSSAHASGRSAG